MTEDSARDQVNALYWESAASVADIADRLGISRRALYDMIEPRPAGARCPACGGELQFRNRTAAERLQPECAECGEETTLERAAEAAQSESATDPRPGRRWGIASPAERAPKAWAGGALLAGLAAGAVAGFFLRRH